MKSNTWELDPTKFLSKGEVERLLDTVKAGTKLNYVRKSVVRDYFIIHLGLASGLRVMEIAKLNCGDLNLEDSIPSILVRNGKGSRKRRVFLSNSFKKHCKEYLAWKKNIGESTEYERPLLISNNTGGYMTTRAIQKAFKRCAQKAGLSAHYSIHCLRHTYACFLLKASGWNLRLVQKQLGHSKITTTQIYADVMMPEIQKALDKLHI